MTSPICRRIELPEQLRGTHRPGYVDVHLAFDHLAYNLISPVLTSKYAEEDEAWPMVPACLEACFDNAPWNDRGKLAYLLRDAELKTWLLNVARDALADAAPQEPGAPVVIR